MLTNSDSLLMLQALAKAVHAGNISELVPEDLEMQAHNTLWNETDRNQLKLLKLLPSTPAKSITHEYDVIDSYGSTRHRGWFSERSLPAEVNFGASRRTVDVKLMGVMGPTFLLAGLQKTVGALGTSGAENIQERALRLNLLEIKNRELYFSDTTTTTSEVVAKGLVQLIREGTDGTVGAASPFGSHIVDMEGEPLTLATIRERAAKFLQLFGNMTTLLMDPLARADLEASLDAASRLDMPVSGRPLLIGQNVGGIQTQGGITYFETDNSLSAMYARPQYSAPIAGDGSPSTRPTLAVTVQADDATTDTVTSRWDAASAGQIFWVATEVVNGREGAGTRYPASVSAYLTVAADQEAELTITPGNPIAESFRIYRGTNADGALTGAWFIFEVPNDGGGGAVTAFDNNLDRPNTTYAFGLDIVSQAEVIMHNGTREGYDMARAASADFLRADDNPRNTVAVAELGPRMGVMQLANVLPTIRNPLLYSACAPFVRNPRKSVVFKNVGRR